MIPQLLLASIATITPVQAPSAVHIVPVRATIATVPTALAMASDAIAGRPVCRLRFGTTSLVQRNRVCHMRAEWRTIDARRRARRRQGSWPEGPDDTALDRRASRRHSARFAIDPARPVKRVSRHVSHMSARSRTFPVSIPGGRQRN